MIGWQDTDQRACRVVCLLVVVMINKAEAKMEKAGAPESFTEKSTRYTRLYVVRQRVFKG